MVAIMPPGRKLRINALTRRAGEVRVEVAGIAGHTFAECVPIVGDQFGIPVTWNGKDDLGYKDGDSITLRFRMEKAKLFGIDFA